MGNNLILNCLITYNILCKYETEGYKLEQCPIKVFDVKEVIRTKFLVYFTEFI